MAKATLRFTRGVSIRPNPWIAAFWRDRWTLKKNKKLLKLSGTEPRSTGLKAPISGTSHIAVSRCSQTEPTQPNNTGNKKKYR